MSKPRAPRPGSIRILHKLAVFDKCDPRVEQHEGHWVEIVQPFGCPPNGTMGHCYVDCVSCGDAKAKMLGLSDKAKSRIFIGLVCLGSLYKPTDPVEIIDWSVKRDGTRLYYVRCADGSERNTVNVPDYLLEG